MVLFYHTKISPLHATSSGHIYSYLYLPFPIKTYVRIGVRSLRNKHTSSHSVCRFSPTRNPKSNRFVAGHSKTNEPVNRSIVFYWAIIVVFVISTTKPVSKFLVFQPNDYISRRDATGVLRKPSRRTFIVITTIITAVRIIRYSGFFFFNISIFSTVTRYPRLGFDLTGRVRWKYFRLLFTVLNIREFRTQYNARRPRVTCGGRWVFRVPTGIVMTDKIFRFAYSLLRCIERSTTRLNPARI